jgi:hypothetical protein
VWCGDAGGGLFGDDDIEVASKTSAGVGHAGRRQEEIARDAATEPVSSE